MAYLAPAEFVAKMIDAGESKIFMSNRDTDAGAAWRALDAPARAGPDERAQVVVPSLISDPLIEFVHPRLSCRPRKNCRKRRSPCRLGHRAANPAFPPSVVHW